MLAVIIVLIGLCLAGVGIELQARRYVDPLVRDALEADQ